MQAPVQMDELDEMFKSQDLNRMNHDERMSIYKLNSQVKTQKEKDSRKPAILSDLKPKAAKIIEDEVAKITEEGKRNVVALENLNKKKEHL